MAPIWSLKRSARLCAAAMATICMVGGAYAEQGLIERLKSGGKIIIAHRESSVPFSYLDADKKPVGYAVDLCVKLAEAVSKKLGAKSNGIEFLMEIGRAHV